MNNSVISDNSSSVIASSRIIRTVLMILALAVLLAQTPGRAFAVTKWATGTVTGNVWKDSYLHVEINGMKFTLMPDVAVRQAVKDSYSDIMQYTASTPENIKKGDKLNFRHQGMRIYEIIINRQE